MVIGPILLPRKGKPSFIFVITARIRRMTEGNVFTLYTIVGGGVPPSQVQMGEGGTPSQVQVGCAPFPGRGYPLPRSGRGTPPGKGVHPHLDLRRMYPPTWEGGTPHLDLGRGIPCHLVRGIPLSRSDPRTGGGTPYWSSIACTCYVAGGMPLAFTQEDFLVTHVST